MNVLDAAAVVQDVLWDKRIKLDDNFKNSFIGEIIKVGDRIKALKSSPNSMYMYLKVAA